MRHWTAPRNWPFRCMKKGEKHIAQGRGLPFGHDNGLRRHRHHCTAARSCRLGGILVAAESGQHRLNSNRIHVLSPGPIPCGMGLGAPTDKRLAARHMVASLPRPKAGSWHHSQAQRRRAGEKQQAWASQSLRHDSQRKGPLVMQPARKPLRWPQLVTTSKRTSESHSTQQSRRHSWSTREQRKPRKAWVFPQDYCRHTYAA